jgi:hypothetical protein
MGLIISTLNQWQSSYYEYFINDSESVETQQEPPKMVNKEMFEDISKHPNIITLFGEIKKKDINVPIDDMDKFINDLVDYIDTYIDLGKMGGKHSKLWKGYVHNDDIELRHVAIKERVIEILKVDERSEKDDKTMAVYLKKIITHTTGDECGGFTLVDERSLKDIPTIKYMHENKMANMNHYISNVINSVINGFVFCTEHDWSSCLTEKDTNIKFHQFDIDIHKDNKAKALYHSSNLVVREFMADEIKAQMTEQGQTHYMPNYDKYADSFVVFNIYDPDAEETDFLKNDMVVIGIHAKSMGSKKDITSNLDEYRLLNSVIQTFSASNMIVLGDFNVPKSNEGREYFGLTEKDMINYPIQDEYDPTIKDDSTFLVKGLTRFIDYDDEDVAYKERTGAPSNSQACGGKCFKRHYNTDLIYGSISGTISHESKLHPTNKDSELMIPLITGYLSSNWLSDHQSVESKITNEHGDSLTVCAYNVLSKCCSEGQPFKEHFTFEQINDARDEMPYILAELTNIILDARTTD